MEAGSLKCDSADNVCTRCYGSGQEVVPGKGARRCLCRAPALIAKRLMKIPPRYEGVTLDSLAARSDIHSGQASTVEYMKTHPEESYVFCGKAGTGKTHLFWALYQRATQNIQRAVVACSMLQLINQYREAFRPQPEGAYVEPQVEIRPNQLMQSALPYSLFFDDIDKPKITEYVAEQVHALFDAAYNFKHQIVVTTNLLPEQLEAHFERVDERYGRATVRRIVHDGNALVEFK